MIRKICCTFAIVIKEDNASKLQGHWYEEKEFVTNSALRQTLSLLSFTLVVAIGRLTIAPISLLLRFVSLFSMIVGIEVRVEALLLFVLEEARTLVGFQLRLCQLRQFSRTHPCHISLVERLAVVEVFLLIIATYVAIALRLISNSASGTSSHARVVVGGADGFVIVMRFAMWLPITGFVVELGYQVASAYLPQLALDGTTLLRLIPEEEHALG